MVLKNQVSYLGGSDYICHVDVPAMFDSQLSESQLMDITWARTMGTSTAGKTPGDVARLTRHR